MDERSAWTDEIGIVLTTVVASNASAAAITVACYATLECTTKGPVDPANAPPAVATNALAASAMPFLPLAIFE